MTLYLYHHPFSSYCQKVLIALYEREVPFQPWVIDLANERSKAELAGVWRYAKFPVLHDTDPGMTLPESSVIVEYLDAFGTAPRLVPADPAASRGVRLWDRLLDNYLHAPMQKIVTDRLRPAGSNDAQGVDDARKTLATTYGMIDSVLVDGACLLGPDLTLADCAAAPALFYAQRVAPFGPDHTRLAAYLDRMMQRPSFRRCIDDARPFRSFFPAAEGDADWPDGEQRTAF